jgi:hypothetical protein
MAKQKHSTEAKNGASGAQGALSVCPASLIPASQSDASQTLASEGEPNATPPTCPIGAGPSMTRRILMNSLVALPIAAALPVAAPAMPSTIAADRGWPQVDSDLVQAAYDLQATDQALRDLGKTFGDDADEREDYLELEDRRDEIIATLITVPARSMIGVQAKSVCVRLRTLIEDHDHHQQVAVSLADDLFQIGPQGIAQPLLAPSEAETVAAAEKFESLLRQYLTVRFEWAELARAAPAEAFEKFGDDYGSDGWSKPNSGTSPGTAFLSELHERNGCRHVSERMSALFEEMEPFAETIRDADVTTIAGLRAKTLVAVWDNLPISADHDGNLCFEDERSHRSLFSGSVAVTGLSSMVDALQTRLQSDASVSLPCAG